MARRTALLTGGGGCDPGGGLPFSPESVQIREFLARTRIPHEWLDADSDLQVYALLQEFDVMPSELPVVISSGVLLRRPSPGELADHLGLTLEASRALLRPGDRGGGPAGLAAAVYGASEGLRTLGVEMVAPGGQAGASSRIENYFGFATGISGADLVQRGLVQAEKSAPFRALPVPLSALGEDAGHLVVHLCDGTTVAGRAVIVASGARYRRLEADRLADFENSGVYYAATDLEARQCAGSPVVVAGGGQLRRPGRGVPGLTWQAR